MSSDLSFRVYPGPKGPPFQLVREGLLLAPYTVMMLATTVLVFGTMSGWRLWLAVAAMLPLHVYLTTDLLLPHFRKAEVMGYGLDRRGPAIRFVGYAGPPTVLPRNDVHHCRDPRGTRRGRGGPGRR